MIETKQEINLYSRYQMETAASSFHLSDTVDWSSLSAQIKNRVVIVDPVHIEVPSAPNYLVRSIPNK